MMIAKELKLATTRDTGKPIGMLVSKNLPL